MDIYDVSEDAAVIVQQLEELNTRLSGGIIVFAALVGMLLGYLAISELLRMWFS